MIEIQDGHPWTGEPGWTIYVDHLPEPGLYDRMISSGWFTWIVGDDGSFVLYRRNDVSDSNLIEKTASAIRACHVKPIALLCLSDVSDWEWDRDTCAGLPVFHGQSQPIQGGVDPCPWIPLFDRGVNAIREAIRFRNGWDEA